MCMEHSGRDFQYNGPLLEWTLIGRAIRRVDADLALVNKGNWGPEDHSKTMGTWVYTILMTLLIHLTAIAPVWAVLGQAKTSVEKDHAAIGGQVQSKFAQGYSVETITAAGMSIKEYVSSDGTVFAVAWRGTGVPNLRLLLGAYFDEYLEALTELQNKKPRIRRPLMLKTANLVVERSGHARNMWGRAFIPSRLPAMVSPKDIQ